MEKVNKIIQECFSGKDNKTPDIHRIMTFFIILSLIIFEGYSVYHNKTFNAMDFGTASGIILGGSGLGISLKSKTEPDL